jgi:hypothetical protein
MDAGILGVKGPSKVFQGAGTAGVLDPEILGLPEALESPVSRYYRGPKGT